MPRPMSEKTFRFYSDPGHGWLAVKRAYLRELGILEKITQFSYQRGETVYLEEDVDAGTFIEAFQQRFNIKPLIKDCFHASVPIRSYERFYHNPVTP
jgi:hypothetical protein